MRSPICDSHARPPPTPTVPRDRMERIKDGFSFPINPVWPVRDPGWAQILEALQKAPGEGAANLRSWFPSDSGVLEKIKKLHDANPGGFLKKAA